VRAGLYGHGALLGVALVAAWQTWTRDRPKPTRANVIVWQGSPSDVTRVTFHTDGVPALDSAPAQPTRDVLLERRGDAGDSYWWGTVSKSTAPVPAPLAVVPDAGPPDAGMDMSPTDLPPEPKKEQPPKVASDEPKKFEFPLGEDGDKLLEKLAPLKAVRDLGVVDLGDRIEDGLGDDVRDELVVVVKGQEHKLVLGGKVYGQDDRYVLDPSNKHVYVVPGDALKPFETAESSLKEHRLHAFAAPDITSASLTWGQKSRSFVHKEAKKPTDAKDPKKGLPPTPPDAEDPNAKATWADSGSPDKVDQTLDNVMDHFSQLVPTDFALDVNESTLTPVVSVDYQGKGGKSIGRLTLYKREKAVAPDAKDDPTGANKYDWFVKTERTRVLAKVVGPSAVRVEQDLGNL
jgi:hypothetical protein